MTLPKISLILQGLILSLLLPMAYLQIHLWRLQRAVNAIQARLITLLDERLRSIEVRKP
jgi:hypothetical protein